VKQAVDGFVTSVQIICKPKNGICLQIMGVRTQSDCILGLIFDTESGREVEGIECEVNTPSK
jgi:hypothetical protein